MRLLIDTQSFIWFFDANSNLPDSVREKMESPNSSLVVSIASFWELTIKISLGKLTLSDNIQSLMNRAITEGFEILPIEPIHLTTLSTLPFFHRDPFDRLIIAQAIAEGISVVSSDAVFKSYSVNWLWRN